MPDCYLHVGTHKTGSTAIQAFINERRQELLARGVLVPLAGRGIGGDHIPLTRILGGEPPPPALAHEVPALAAELAAHPSCSVVLSSEAMEQHFRPRHRSAIVEFFRSRGYAIKLVCYVRPQVPRINASYVQGIKTFVFNVSVGEHVRRNLVKGWLSYSRWLRIAEAHEVELLALPYNAAVRREGVVRSFLGLLGLEDLAPASDEYRKNPTVGTAAVAAARTCMDRLKGEGVRLTQLQWRRCAEILSDADQAFPSASFSGISPDLAADIEDRYWADNEYFAGRVWQAKWGEIFGPGDAAPANEVARDRAESPHFSQYLAILERIWPAVSKVAADPELAQRQPFEREPLLWKR